MTEVENEVSEEIISVFCSLIHICELFINIERKWQKEFPLCASEKQYKVCGYLHLEVCKSLQGDCKVTGR